ncbi:primase-helicase zinc-binding domain-containing protein [Escherichia coli]
MDDKAGRGTWFCNQCGHGDGLDLVRLVTGRKIKKSPGWYLRRLHYQKYRRSPHCQPGKRPQEKKRARSDIPDSDSSPAMVSRSI